MKNQSRRINWKEGGTNDRFVACKIRWRIEREIGENEVGSLVVSKVRTEKVKILDDSVEESASAKETSNLQAKNVSTCRGKCKCNVS